MDEKLIAWSHKFQISPQKVVHLNLFPASSSTSFHFRQQPQSIIFNTRQVKRETRYLNDAEQHTGGSKYFRSDSILRGLLLKPQGHHVTTLNSNDTCRCWLITQPLVTYSIVFLSKYSMWKLAGLPCKMANPLRTGTGHSRSFTLLFWLYCPLVL